ncbi:SPOC domain-like protein [Dentipellis sp. KUC8613]|nr:SPOC domain-like protein [Dentipellis sp. KUC8613]
MAAQRAGYTVTMFLVDVSPSMGKTRTVELPDGPNGELRDMEMTHLEWALQFVMLKIQEMIFNGRKTDQCGVILFGTDETENCINETNGGYEHVSEYIHVGQPNANTLSKLAALRPSEDTHGDPIDALIVGIETQDRYLSKKKTWTRKVVLLTDGESPIEIEDWKATVKKMQALDVGLTIVGVDFDDDEIEFHEEDKPHIKKENEAFYHKLTEALPTSVIGTLALALEEVSRPEIKQTRSTLMGTILRLGDPENDPLESMEIVIKTSKCTALARPKGWKRFAPRETAEHHEDEDMDMDGETEKKNVWTELKMRTEYFIDTTAGEDKEDDEDEDEDTEDKMDVDGEEKKQVMKVEKEDLVKGFKYGSTFVPCPDGQFERLTTRKGIEICGFFAKSGFRREYPMGEIQYVWADPTQPQQQVALSSLVQAMEKQRALAIARWVGRDGSDPKMGVLYPCEFERVDCLLWAQMPFADDLRKYTFSPLENLVNKKGEKVTKHPYIPTDDQVKAMENFVDAMDLMDAGEKNEDGKRDPWFDPRLSYNPAIHRTKQALFHSAVVQDLATNPLPPPHPELTKYFEPPRRVLKRARGAIEEVKTAFKVKEVPKRVARQRKNEHVHAQDEDEELLLDRVAKPATQRQTQRHRTLTRSPTTPRVTRIQLKRNDNDSESETESDNDDMELLLTRKGTGKGKAASPKLPTPSASPEGSPPPDPGRAPGRIVGTTAPLRDFQRNIAQGDIVSKAVEDMGWAVQDVVMRPFSARRHGEMRECLRALRAVCSQEDEIDAWNSILQGLKEACLSDPGNAEFWEEVRKEKQTLGLIGKSEAKKLGGKSGVSDAAAEAFWEQ